MPLAADIPKLEKRQALHWLMQTVRRVRVLIGFSIGVALISGFALILQASLLANIVQRSYLQHQSRYSLLGLIIGLFMIIAARAGLAWLREVVSFQAGAKVRHVVRTELIAHLTKLGPVANHHLQSGALTTVLIEQVEALQAFVADYLPQLALAVMLPLVIVAFIFPVNWLSALLLLVIAPLIPIFMAFIGMGAAAVNQRHWQSLARLGAKFLDVLQGLTTIKLLQRESEQLNTIAASAEDYRVKTMSVLRIAFLSSAVLELLSSVAIAILAVYLGLYLIDQVHFGNYGQALNLKHALFILLLAPEFFMPLRQLGVHYHARAEAVAASCEIIKLLNMPVEAPSGGVQKLHATRQIALRVQQLAFQYPERGPLFKDFNVAIAAHEKLAIQGPSGIGKTTLLHLIAGFLQPQAGEIFVNGMGLKALALSHWHQQIAWLGQQTRLFCGSLRDNILLAKPDASTKEFNHAIAMAHVVEFSQELPHGLDTLVGENNAGLSGGQIQRIALARAFLKNAPLLLLDEPTANLDTSNEAIVLDALSVLANHKTVIMVSHHAGALAFADRVITLGAVKNSLQECC